MEVMKNSEAEIFHRPNHLQSAIGLVKFIYSKIRAFLYSKNREVSNIWNISTCNSIT